ncbi:MAG: hypothetical protein DYG89_43630 [Caldilinea sp. CFX5]|nr:hypothetical protein [Caldilinea sp. CFX5]
MFAKRFPLMLAAAMLCAASLGLFVTPAAYAQAVITDQAGNPYWVAADDYGNPYIDQYGNQCLVDANGYVYAINAYNQLYLVDGLGCYTNWASTGYSAGGYAGGSGGTSTYGYDNSNSESTEDGWSEWYAEQGAWHNSWGDWYNEQSDYYAAQGDYDSAEYYAGSASSSYDNGSYYNSYSSDDE